MSMADLIAYRITSRPPLCERHRRVRGEQHPKAKLTDEQRDSIPALLASGHTCRSLASRWGVGHSTISRYSGGNYAAHSKLKATDMPLVIELREGGMTLTEIGEKFGVHGSTVQKAIRRWQMAGREARRQ